MNGDEGLPHGWTVAKVADIVTDGPTNGYSGRTGQEGTWTLKLSATTLGWMLLNDKTTKRLAETVPRDSKYWLEPGDLLVQRANSLKYLGAAAIYHGERHRYVYPDLMMRLRLQQAPTRSYLWRYFNSMVCREHFRSKATGTAGNMPKINGKTLRETAVPLPPLNEQRRIVAKIDALQGHSHRAREALDAIDVMERLLVHRYTTGWPEGRLGDSLEDVTTEVGEGWQNYPARGLTNDGKITERKEPIAEKSAKKCRIVREGDIVFNPIRFSIGSIARYHGHEDVIVSPEYRVVRTKNELSAELLTRFLRTPLGRSLLSIKSTGSVRYRVYFKHLREVSMPIAPPEVQRQAEEFFLTLNTLSAIRRSVGEQLEILDQAILAKAFRGELVPQDPDDEPASILLERIRSERATAAKNAPRGRGRRKRNS